MIPPFFQVDHYVQLHQPIHHSDWIHKCNKQQVVHRQKFRILAVRFYHVHEFLVDRFQNYNNYYDVGSVNVT